MGFLTEARVRAVRPQEKAYKVFDSLGLYLKVETSGGRLWRFKYRYGNVEKLLSLGAQLMRVIWDYRGQRIADRRKMMQAWADYLDGLRSSEMKPPAHSGDAETVEMMRFERDRSETAPSGWEYMSLPRAANGPRRRLDN